MTVLNLPDDSIKQSPRHLWLDDVGGVRVRGDRSLYVGRDGPDKFLVRIASSYKDGTECHHTDVYLNREQATDMALWLLQSLAKR